MGRNSRILLDQVLSEKQAEQPGVDDGKIFEELSCELVGKNFDLSVGESHEGKVGGSDDGGLDGIYTLVNGKHVASDDAWLQEETHPTDLPSGSRVDFVTLQAKRDAGFPESAIDKAHGSLKRLLDLGESPDSLRRLYNADVVEKVERFRQIITKYALRNIQVNFFFFFASRGDVESNVNIKFERKCRDLEELLRSTFSPSESQVKLLGADELWSIVSQVPSYDLGLTCSEYATGTQDSHIALVTVAEYMKFLRNDNGEIRSEIFDSNVRDYQGLNISVNSAIEETIESPDPDDVDFWWLNNGVTILCDRAVIATKTLSLSNVQIVNGLQTSHTLFLATKKLPESHPIWKRKVLVRILQTADNGVRDRVIRATNSQTAVKPASLRATDKIQRDIEQFFAKQNLFYDRRKNYYRNIGKPSSRIIDIAWLAQAVTAMGLSQPDMSRARPSSLLKDDARYNQVFNEKTDISVYLKAAKAQRMIDSVLQSPEANISGASRLNVKYHVSMLVAAVSAGREVYAISQLAGLDEDFATAANIRRCLAATRAALRHQTRATGRSQDSLAKSSDFRNFLLREVLPLLLSASDDDTAIKYCWPWLSESSKSFLTFLSHGTEIPGQSDVARRCRTLDEMTSALTISTSTLNSLIEEVQENFSENDFYLIEVDSNAESHPGEALVALDETLAAEIRALRGM